MARVSVQLNLHSLHNLGKFEYLTSSPRYAQSKGKAENAVQTVKQLFRKCKDTRQSEFLALLDWRDTPTEGMGTSPAERLWVDGKRRDLQLHRFVSNTFRQNRMKYC